MRDPHGVKTVEYLECGWIHKPTEVKQCSRTTQTHVRTAGQVKLGTLNKVAALCQCQYLVVVFYCNFAKCHH